MIRRWREQHASDARPHYNNTTNDETDAIDTSSSASTIHRRHQFPRQRICIAVRKRPVSDKERDRNDHDSITVLNPTVWIHSARVKVDGITKYLDHSGFTFDHAFDEAAGTDTVYRCTTMPLLNFCLAGLGGRVTVFAFGQTGSGVCTMLRGYRIGPCLLCFVGCVHCRNTVRCFSQFGIQFFLLNYVTENSHDAGNSGDAGSRFVPFARGRCRLLSGRHCCHGLVL
jgi:Kinesin motor domain